MPTTKIPFRTAYNHEIETITPAGTRLKPIYEYEIKKDGRKQLVKTGEENLYDEIQSHLESVLIENVIKRLDVGDTSAFRKDGVYLDVSGIPNNMADAMKMRQKIENDWLHQPIEVREKFDNDINKYIATAGERSWLIATGAIKIDEPISPKAENTVPETTPEVPEEPKNK